MDPWTANSENSTYSTIYFGCFPGNLQNWSSATFQGLVAARNNTKWLSYNALEHTMYLSNP
jgi:hypothetical protein